MRLLFALTFLLATASTVRSTDIQLDGAFGGFTSPGFPRTYADNLNDSWTITVTRGYRVVVSFADFDLEDSFDLVPCTQDYVELIDSPQTNETTQRFCGNPTLFGDDAPVLYKQKFVSTGNTITVRMVSDYSNNLPGLDKPLVGFRAYYFQEDRDECAELRSAAAQSDEPENVGMCEQYCNNYPGGYNCSCRRGYILHTDKYSCVGDCMDEVRTDDHGILMSPGFPKIYFRLTECSWKIKTRAGQTLQIVFNRTFNIEEHHSGFCPYDWVKISDSSGDRGTFCGSVAPNGGNAISSTTNWFKITFHTDKTTELSGFQLAYKAKAIVCDLPPPPGHASLARINDDLGSSAPNTVPFGAIIRFECEQGYRLIGSAKVACLKDGTLSDDTPFCEVF